MKTFVAKAIAILAVGMLYACESTAPEPKPDGGGEEQRGEQTEKPEEPKKDNNRQDIDLSRSETSIVSSEKEFSFDLMRSVSSIEKDKNVMLSPMSAFMNLSMFANGASPSAGQSLFKVLRLGEAGLDDLNNLNLRLMEKLPEMDAETEVGLANSLWIDKRVSMVDKFAENGSRFYKSSSETLDMYDLEARDRINSWSAEVTNGMIRQVYRDAPCCDVAALSAVYFNGRWNDPFEESLTSAGKFRNSDGSMANVDMMSKKRWELLCEKENYSALKLTFGNESYSMTFVLPADGKGVNEVLAGMDAAAWSDLQSELRPSLADMRIPRFELMMTTGLTDAVRLLGGGSLFDDRSSFPAITSSQSPLDGLSQVVCIKVTEAGAEAAGVTNGWVSSPGDDDEPEVHEFIVDRPFLFVIEEFSTGVVLFSGVVNAL